MKQMVKARIDHKSILHYLVQQNVSQNQLASNIGISSGYMSQLMNGHRCPSPKLRKRMLQELKPLAFADLFIIHDEETASEGAKSTDKSE